MKRLQTTFDEVTTELDRRRFISMGFERIEALLAALGNPQESLRVVQVVGTNGKGTTSVALSAALEVAGEATGTYLSPHVVSYSERVRVRGEQVSEEAFSEGMGKVISVADELGVEVTQFELLTAGALAMFRDAGVTWAVMEAGLGARYDATTAARPEAVVLTNVSLDHTQYLGDTIQEIAAEKLASVPHHGTLILGTEDPAVISLARSRCETTSARLVIAEESERSAFDPAVFRLEPGSPPHVRRNVELGCLAAGTLLGSSVGSSGKRLSEDALGLVLRAVSHQLPGRFEVLRLAGADVVLDGGHNVEGLKATLDAMREHYPARRIGIVFGVLKDKDIKGMLALLKEVADPLYLTRPEDERAADPRCVYGEIEASRAWSRKVFVEPEIGVALGRAIGEARSVEERGVVLVTGSFTTVAVAKEFMSGFSEGDAEFL